MDMEVAEQDQARHRSVRLSSVTGRARRIDLGREFLAGDFARTFSTAEPAIKGAEPYEDGGGQPSTATDGKFDPETALRGPRCG